MLTVHYCFANSTIDTKDIQKNNFIYIIFVTSKKYFLSIKMNENKLFHFLLRKVGKDILEEEK